MLDITLEQNVLIIVSLFLIGITLGSFFGVVGMRIPRGESINNPKFSHCETCNRQLKWFELIPVLSWIFLLGKCYKCKTKLSVFYPIIEFVTGVLFVYTYLMFGVSFEAVFFLLLICLLIIISISDIFYGLIPNKILLFFSIILIPMSFFYKEVSLIEQGVGFGMLVLIMLLLIAISRGKGIGGGDIKLFALLSVVLGWKYFAVGFMMSVIIAFVYSSIKTLVKKDREIKFGPFIALGFIITFFYYEELVHLYVHYVIY